MMEKKKKINYFKIILILLFIIYISLYTLNVSGYYDGSIKKKVEFTSEQIKEFESDIENGEPVDVKDYLKGQNKDYTNGASRLGYQVSKNIDNFLNRGIKNFFKLVMKFLT